MPGVTSTSRHRTEPRAPRRGITPRPLLLGSGAVATVVVLMLFGAGGTFALWNDRAEVNAATITAGTSGVTVNGQQDYAIEGLGTSLLGPGASVATPVTVANTGATALSVTVSQGSVTAQTRAMADELTITLTPVANSASCTTGLAGGASGRIAGFTTSVSPLSLPVGGSVVLCLQLALDKDAPASTQGGTASFRLTLDAAQVAP